MLDSMAWTNWPLFTVGLVQRGHKDQTIRRIVGQNMLRVLQAHETSSPPRLTETV
jgi:membrane dipeptidase